MALKQKELSPWQKHFESAVSAIFFIAFVAAHLLFGISIAVKVLGASCVFMGAVLFIRRTVSFGIEGRPSSFIVRGMPAILCGVAMTVIGIAMWRYSLQVACMLNWASEKACS